MNRRRFIALSLGTGASIGLVPKLHSQPMSRVEEKSIALGADISIVAYHEQRATAQRAIRAAFQALEDLEVLLSLYRPHSQICELNRERLLKQPHPDTVMVIGSALEWARLTDGAFDPTVQPLWAVHAATGAPNPSTLENARRLVNWRTVNVTPSEIRLAPGQQITLNGIAPGFAADRVREILVAHGIKHALVNTGEFCALGPKPEGGPWQIGIQHPRVREAYAALAAVENRFLATSGDYETKFSEDFSRHHIFDPATGRSPSELSSVTVLAPTGMDADALSTAIFVLGAARGLELAASRKNVDVLLITKNGRVARTPNFPGIA
jgi:thiamine biosynthesis lipoprotein